MSLRTRLILSAVQLAVGAATIPAVAQDTAPAPAGTAKLVERFNAANTTHDGRLTLDQAQAAHMRGVARDFASIDAQNKGYITMDDLRAYRRQQHAAKTAASIKGAVTQ